MDVVNTVYNEPRFETVGDTSIKFEKMGKQWMVSSIEIYEVFEEEATVNHDTMVKQFKERGEEWDDFTNSNQIIIIDCRGSTKLPKEVYYFNIVAFRFYALSMSGTKSAEFRLAFMKKFE